MVLPKNTENIMSGSYFRRASVAESWSKERDVDTHKKETSGVSRPRDEGRVARECLPYGGD